MFDPLKTLSPRGLIDVIEETHRAESMLMASKVAAIAALLAERTAEAENADPDPGYALITGFARTCAEVSAAMNLSPMGASALVAQADVLDARLPKIAALLAEGVVDWRTVAVIIARTELVTDAVIGRLDEALAHRITRWRCWSRRRIVNTVDAAVRTLDADAVKERRVAAHDGRYVAVGAGPDGMAVLRGRVGASAAAAFDKRLSQLATSVCKKDPRSLVQRRADAVGALAEGRMLSCACAQPNCPARGDAKSGRVATSGVRTVINVIASQSTVSGSSEQPGYLDGYGVIDAEQVRELAQTAAMHALEPPAVSAADARRYQPSAALANWIRCRDVTCRFPGCDRPAAICDLDHTVAFNHADPGAGGLTVPENLACYCREHHRLKTFHGGVDGWRDDQRPDGTIVWASPSGQEYHTTPGGTELFTQLRPACAEPVPRRRSRSQEITARIARARTRNRAQRPINKAARLLNRARKREIEARKFRNHMRDMLFALKGKPSVSPFCRWVNEPHEPEQLPADWRPPPPPSEPNEPPF